MRLFDTHCHLDDPRLREDLDDVLARAREAGVLRMTTIGCAQDVASVRSALAIAHAHPQAITATVGVHPHDAKEFNDAIADALVAAGQDDAVVAIGETGLDHHYDHSPHDLQEAAFRAQIEIAKQLKKPLVIHTRSAPADTLRILREGSAKSVGGIIHCFSENTAFAKAALDLGFVASFSGIVTFKAAADVHEAARAQPGDALLVETDAPYLAPVPKRGKLNEPGYVAHTATRIAELRGDDPEALAARTYDNAMRVFGLSD